MRRVQGYYLYLFNSQYYDSMVFETDYLNSERCYESHHIGVIVNSSSLSRNHHDLFFLLFLSVEIFFQLEKWIC